MEIIPKWITFIFLVVFFIAFAVKNVVTKKRTNLAVKGNSIRVNLMVIVSGTLYTLAFLNIFSHPVYLINIGFFSNSLFKIIGLFLMLTGLTVGLAALITMKDSWRVGIRQEQKTVLIENGLFSLSRNPFFLSYIIFFLGVFLVFPSVILLMAYFAMIIIIHTMILDEEKYLTKTHGDEYLNYKNLVGRYITLKLKR